MTSCLPGDGGLKEGTAATPGGPEPVMHRMSAVVQRKVYSSASPFVSNVLLVVYLKRYIFSHKHTYKETLVTIIVASC